MNKLVFMECQPTLILIAYTSQDAKETIKNEKTTKEVQRKEISYHFEKELIENQNKHFHVVTEFVPSKIIYPLESKFWARHEQQMPQYEKFMKYTEHKQIQRRASNNYPRLESQVYGWLPETPRLNSSNCINALKQLNFINAPKQRCNMTVYGEKFASDRITERPPFNGLRFVVQHK